MTTRILLWLVVTMNLQRKAMCGFKLVSKYSNIKFVTTYCWEKPCKAHMGIQQLCSISLLFDPIISEYGECLSFSTLLLPCDFETDMRESHDH